MAIQLEAESVAVDVEAEILIDYDQPSPLTSDPVQINSNFDDVDNLSGTDDDQGYLELDVDDVCGEPKIQKPDKSSITNNMTKKTVPSSPISSNIHVVAGSVKTGLGLEDFYAKLLDVATVTLFGIDIEVPYSLDNGVVASIHNVGIVEEVRYTDTATIISAKVPQPLLVKLKKFIVTK